jgi:acyl-CoA reductase-like NAD-dependent aldehyde dehydrogenase
MSNLSKDTRLPNIQDCLPKHLDLFYGGKWQKSLSNDYRETINPGNNTVIDKVAFAGADDATAAIEAAQKALPAWRATPPNQ